MSWATLGPSGQGAVTFQGTEPGLEISSILTWFETSLIRTKSRPVTISEKEIKSVLSRTVVEVFAFQDPIWQDKIDPWIPVVTLALKHHRVGAWPEQKSTES